MNLRSPVPVWLSLCVVALIVGGVYAAARSMIAPQVDRPTLEPALANKPPWPSIVPEAPTASATVTISTPAADCSEFDSLQDAARHPKEVCYLVLGDQGLAEVPPEIQQMTNIEFLFLQNNQLATLPHWIGTLTSLRVIDADNNRLEDLPIEIGKLTNLATLSVANNQITTLSPEIAWLTNLESLNLNRNQLTELPSLAQLRNLQELSVTGNELKVLPNDISGLTRLKYLYLRDNQVSHIPPLNGLPLESVGLAGNPICGSDAQIDSADRVNLPSTATSLAAMVCIPVLEGRG